MNLGPAVFAAALAAALVRPSLQAMSRIAGPGAAAPTADFTFRTVRPPPASARKRVILQKVEPAPASPETDAFRAAPGASAALRPNREVVPLLAAAGPAPAAAAEAARRLMAAHGPHFRRAAAENRLTLPLLLAVALAESSGDSSAVSPRGAQGLMQLMPATAAGLRADPFAPHEAVPAAAAHPSSLLVRFDEDVLAALAACNAGAGAASRHRGAPPYPETRACAPRVLALFGALRSLCLHPPETARAACRPSAALSPPGRLRSSP